MGQLLDLIAPIHLNPVDLTGMEKGRREIKQILGGCQTPYLGIISLRQGFL